MAGIRGAEARERRERTHDGAGRRDRLRDGAAVGGRRGRRGRRGRGDAGRGGGLGRFLVLLGLDLLGRGRGVAAAGEGGRGRLGGDDERLRVLGGDLLHRRDGGFCRVAAGRGEGGDGDGRNETGDGRDGHEATHRVRAAAQAARGLRGCGCRGSGGRRQTSSDRDASRTALIGCRRFGLGCLLRRIELFSQWSSGASAALPQGKDAGSSALGVGAQMYGLHRANDEPMRQFVRRSVAGFSPLDFLRLPEGNEYVTQEHVRPAFCRAMSRLGRPATLTPGARHPPGRCAMRPRRAAPAPRSDRPSARARNPR